MFAPQAKKILLFAFAKQDPTCLLVVVHCKVVSTLDKKKHQIPPDQDKVTARRSAGHHPRQEERARSHDRRRHLFATSRSRSLASNYLYIGDCSEFLCFYWLVRLYSNVQTNILASAELVQRIHEAVASSDSAAGGPAGSEHPQGAVFDVGKPLNAVCCPQESLEICM